MEAPESTATVAHTLWDCPICGTARFAGSRFCPRCRFEYAMPPDPPPQTSADAESMRKVRTQVEAEPA